MIKHLIKYLFQKINYRGLLDFDFSDTVEMNSSFEGKNKLASKSYFGGTMGYASYIASNCFIQAKIGRFTSIGPRVSVIIGSHPYTYPFVTTCPAFYSLKKQCGFTFADKEIKNTSRYAQDKYPVVIGNDCWINSDVKIVSGVTIGDGAVVLAGAIVTHDVPPYTIVGGVPAKELKKRYDGEDIEFLLELKWWDKDLKWLSDNWQLLNNIENLKAFVRNGA